MKKIFTIIILATIISSTMIACSTKTESGKISYIDKTTAYSVALESAKIDPINVQRNTTQLVDENNSTYYNVEFVSNDVIYNYSIDAVSGNVISHSSTKDNPDAPSSSAEVPSNTSAPSSSQAESQSSSSQSSSPISVGKPISLEDAKQIAIDHAGKTSKDVSFRKAIKELEDGIWVYEIEFFTRINNSYEEYEYEINTETGEIIKHSYELNGYVQNSDKGALKSEDEILKIALAQVPGATAKDATIFLDNDDRRLVYEGKIIYSSTKYDFEIDPYSGTILEWEVEPLLR